MSAERKVFVAQLPSDTNHASGEHLDQVALSQGVQAMSEANRKAKAFGDHNSVKATDTGQQAKDAASNNTSRLPADMQDQIKALQARAEAAKKSGKMEDYDQSLSELAQLQLYGSYGLRPPKHDSAGSHDLVSEAKFHSSQLTPDERHGPIEHTLMEKALHKNEAEFQAKIAVCERTKRQLDRQLSDIYEFETEALRAISGAQPEAQRWLEDVQMRRTVFKEALQDEIKRWDKLQVEKQKEEDRIARMSDKELRRYLAGDSEAADDEYGFEQTGSITKRRHHSRRRDRVNSAGNEMMQPSYDHSVHGTRSWGTEKNVER